MHWHDQILIDLNKKYPELQQYNTDATQVIKLMFSQLRKLMAERHDVQLQGLGRFVIPPGRIWKQIHLLYKKYLQFKDEGKDTTRVEERLHYLIATYNEIVIKLHKQKTKKIFSLLQFEEGLLTTQNSIPWNYSPNSKLGQINKTQTFKPSRFKETM